LQCQNNLKQIGLAIHNYAQQYNAFPAGESISLVDCARSNTGYIDCRGNSLYVVILPFIEQSGYEEKYNYDIGYYMWAQANIELYRMKMPVYQCPSDDRPQQYVNMRSYYGVSGGQLRTTSGWRGDVFLDGLFTINRWRRFGDIADGTSSTLAVGESSHNAYYGDAYYAGSATATPPGYGVNTIGAPCAWVAGDACSKTTCPMSSWSVGRGFRSSKWPINYSLFNPTMDDFEENDVPFSSFHSGGAYFVYADGHVGWLNDTIPLAMYRALSTFAGGETISGADY
jgi:prepilin-type processing-associated H-X9-DG protein